MRNKNILIIIGLIAAFAFLAFSIGFYLTRRSVEPVVIQQPAAPAADETTAAPSGVADVGPRGENWEEGYGSARASGDSSKCEAILDANARAECKDRVILSQALTSEDMSKCRSISNYNLRDICYIKIGSATGNDYCDYLTSANEKIRCLELSSVDTIIDSGSINECADLTTSARAACFNLIIEGYSNVSQCEAIGDEAYRGYCLARFE